MVLSTIEGQTVDCYPLRQSEELDYAGWVKSEKSEWGCRVEEAVSPERERVSLKQTEQQTSHGWHCAEDQGKHLLYKAQSTLQMISLFASQRDQTKLRIMNFIMVLQRHLENILLSWKEFFEKLKFNETSDAKNYIKWKCFLCRIYFLVIFCEMILLCGLSQQFHVIFVTFSAWPLPLRKCVTMHFIFLHLTSLTSYILHYYLLIEGQEAQIVLILDGGKHGGGQSLAAEGEEQVNISSWFSDTRSPQIHPIDLLLVLFGNIFPLNHFNQAD